MLAIAYVKAVTVSRVISLAIWLGLAVGGWGADGYIRLNNRDSNAPIFYSTVPPHLPIGSLLPIQGSYVQVLAGSGTAVSFLTNTTGESVFRLTEPGFFDGGVAMVPGVGPGEPAIITVSAFYENPEL